MFVVLEFFWMSGAWFDSYYVDVNDSITLLQGAPTFSVGLNKTDTQVFVDVLRKDICKPFLDATLCLDQISKAVSLLAPPENVPLTDVAPTKDVTKNITSTFTLSDFITRDFSREFQDAISLVDTLVKSPSLFLFDSFSLTDFAAYLRFVDPNIGPKTVLSYRYRPNAILNLLLTASVSLQTKSKSTLLVNGPSLSSPLFLNTPSARLTPMPTAVLTNNKPSAILEEV